MKIKQIWTKVKKQWLILTIILAVLIVSTIMNSGGKMYAIGEPLLYGDMDNYMAKSSGMVAERMIVSEPYYGEEDFRPEIEDRQIEKNAFLNLEVKRGVFKEVEEELRSLVKFSDSFILNQNVNKYGESYHGSYTIKVNNEKYEFFVLQAKELGKVLSFNDNARDVTGNIVGLEERIVKEINVLNELRDLFQKARTNDEKVKLREKITNQERFIDNLKDNLNNQENRVEYSTVSVTLQEAASKYDTDFVGFSELVNKLVRSFNGLLRWLVGVLPWAILGFLVWLIIKLVKNRI
jgi:hypothetical protein